MKAFRINHKMILIWLNYTLPSITVVNSSAGIYSILAVLGCSTLLLLTKCKVTRKFRSIETLHSLIRVRGERFNANWLKMFPIQFGKV